MWYAILILFFFETVIKLIFTCKPYQVKPIMRSKKKKVFTHNIKYAQLEDFIANCLIIHLKRKVFHTQLLLTNDLG